LVAFVAADAAPAATTAQVRTAMEAWYQAAGATGTAGPGIEAAVPPVNPYGEGSLHVGVKAGTEDGRTYLTLDGAALAGSITSATLVLPVDPGNGTAAPDTAALDVCLAPDPGEEASGSLAVPPPADCSLSAPARYEAEPRPRFVADISAFAADVLGGGVAGLAVLPSAAARATNATWHVAFYGREHAPEQDLAIHAIVETAGDEPPVAVGETGTALPLVTPAEITVDDSRPSFADIAASTRTPPPPLAAPAPLLGGDQQVSMPAIRPVAASGSGFAYPAVLALPLALLALGALLGPSLVRDPTVRALVGRDEQE
jgi:hypothetical protein